MCHYTAKEAAKKTGKSYSTIVNYYRGFKIAELTKYDRKQLSLWEGFSHDKAVNE